MFAYNRFKLSWYNILVLFYGNLFILSILTNKFFFIMEIRVDQDLFDRRKKRELSVLSIFVFSILNDVRTVYIWFH